MPTASLKLKPTVNAEFTPALNESAIASANLIRFRSGLPEKLGGWTRIYSGNVAGVPKSLHAWEDLSATTRLAIATTSQLAILTGSTLQLITPQTLISNFSPDFTTAIGSPNVTVIDPNISNVTTFDSIFFNTPISVGGLILQGTYQIAVVDSTHSYTIVATSNATALVTSGGSVPSFSTTVSNSNVTIVFANHGLAVGDNCTFPIATLIGGVTVLGTYQVLTVPDANSFTISATALATSNDTESMNGGDAELIYYLNLGPAAPGTGFGLGGYGTGGFGSGVVNPSQTGTPISATDWTTDNWGNDLLCCPKGGGIYFWTPNSGFSTAGLIPTAPIFNNGIFVAMPEQILVCYGSTEASPGSVGEGDFLQQDPLLVRWSDSLDFTNFVVSIQTQAGSFRIPTGSQIIGGLQGPQQALIWTDIDVYAMSYLGFPLVFGFNKISSGCGLIGPHAAAVMRGNIYWMSNGNFFVLSGNGVQVIPCSVWDAVFQNINTNFMSKCVAAPNSAFDEMWFFYPSSASSGECDSYAKLNLDLQSWDYGTIPRTAWIDQSAIGQPIGTTPNGIIYQHETSPDADGQPLGATFTTGWFTVADGELFSFVDFLYPDMRWEMFDQTNSATIQITFEAADYPNQNPTRVYGPYTLTQATQFLNLRMRGRLIRLTIASVGTGSWWRLGNMRYRAAPIGMR